MTETTYDAIGRLLTSTLKGVSGCDTSADPLCATDLTSTRTYAPLLGPLAADQRPSGGVTTYEYDSRGRVSAISRGPAMNDLRERLETSYDTSSGQKSQERTYARESASWVEKRRESYAYDGFGRLITTTHADNATITYTYDPASSIASVKDENHSAANTTYAYDATKRLTGITQTLASAPGGHVTTHYAYDIQGNLTSVTDPNGNVTTYVYDDFGRMLSQTSPVTGTTTYAYDAGANLTSTVDANGSTTMRTYDALARVTGATSSRSGVDTEVVTWIYDVDICNSGNHLGRLAMMTDPSGDSTYCYDRRGLLTASSDSNLFQSSYTYDENGNRTSIVYPSSRTVTYTFDFADRPVTASTDGTAVIDDASYLPFGPQTQLVFGNGTTRSTLFDQRYRPLANTLTGPSGPIAAYTYAADAAGNITQIHDAVDPAYNRDFGYDELNRLTVANGSNALWGTGSYQYDAMGNLLSLQLGARSLTFAYAGSTPKLQSVSGTTPASLSYDAAGNETSSGTYGPRNLMATLPDLNRVFTYDGRGVRVRASFGPGSPLTDRTFWLQQSFYSPELHLLARSDWKKRTFGGLNAPGWESGTEYIWFGDQPVAQAFTDPEQPLRFTFNDHLGTPLLQTDPDGTIVWRAEYEPYGSIYAYRAGNADDPQALRLPGQEASDFASTDLSYNIFRWYRSGWGRYSQSDPLLNFGTLTGMLGGHLSSADVASSMMVGNSEYGYADDSSVDEYDPLGLRTIRYDGCYVSFLNDQGDVEKICSASSGVPHSTPQDQARQNYGPIPEGAYTLNPSEFTGGWKSMFRTPGWGRWRAPLHPRKGTKMYGRTNVFIHGDTRDLLGSHGCIDLAHCDTWARDWAMKQPSAPINVIVKFGLKVCN